MYLKQYIIQLFYDFSLLVRQYDAVGELIRALEKTYVINSKTRKDVAEMWIGLSQIRALLPVQMSQEEEELMRTRLWYVIKYLINLDDKIPKNSNSNDKMLYYRKLVNNHTFFQHPDLIR